MVRILQCANNPIHNRKCNFRPVSAYAMFFRERQIFAKKSFPNATFGDISRIVAAEWDALGKNERDVSVIFAVANDFKILKNVNAFTPRLAFHEFRH
ncbi:unnamed protein product [Nippostrongylus brasiliensis]|uniref:HMG box domain-containing protein n=1 Tax=Nippostrongylus brasiliensis TaxID=27835 RepID=A0A0N4XDC9_NIPBR|nr:unnamed protein product [Nippostrongylus brasiliensis]